MRSSRLIIPLLLFGCLAAGCTSSSRELRLNREQSTDEFAAALPPVLLSSVNVIHSPHGDMSAKLPQHWVTVDPSELHIPDVFAAACDPDYTMSLVFSEAPVDDAARRGYRQDGLRGLAEVSFQRRRARSQSPVELVGPVEQFALGRRMFSAYTYSADSMRTMTRVAVFVTDSHLYECAVTHLTFSGHELPNNATLREIQQLVLASVEW